MWYKRLFTITLVVHPLLLTNGVASIRSIGFTFPPHYARKFHSFNSLYALLPEQIVSIADGISNYQHKTLPPITKSHNKNLYVPGETYNIDSTTLKIYANELSQLLHRATLIGVTQVSQERLHAIFLHFQDKWRGTSRLIIYHPNKFYPPIYLGSRVATLYNISNISPTYLEDTLNILKSLTVSRVSFTMSNIHGVEIELLDKTVGNSKYLLKFTPGTRRNNLTVTDVTSELRKIELFNSDDWIFPEKKRQFDRTEMLKSRRDESRKLYKGTNNGNLLESNYRESSSLDVNGISRDSISRDSDYRDNNNSLVNDKTEDHLSFDSQSIFEFGNSTSPKIPISRLMSQSVPGLSHGTAVDICQSESIPEEKLTSELTSVELQHLMNKVKSWRDSLTDGNVLPHISKLDDVYYFNVTNFRNVDVNDSENLVFTSVMEMLYCYYESNTIPCRHRDLANKAIDLCKQQGEKLQRMASSLSPSETPERMAIIQEKLDLLDKYNTSISDCRLYTTMDSYQMLLEMVEDLQELISSKCTGTSDRLKLKGKALDFDRELHSITRNTFPRQDTSLENTRQNTSSLENKNRGERLYGGLLSLKCLVDDPDSPVLVIGRNAKQNDKIVSVIGKPNDLWFHASHVPGAHVLLKSTKEFPKEVVDKVIQFAADVAAYFSKAKGGRKSYSSPNVTPCIGDSSVDVTIAKFSDIVKEDGMDEGAVIVKSGKIIKANPKRARKKVEDVISQRIRDNSNI